MQTENNLGTAEVLKGPPPDNFTSSREEEAPPLTSQQNNIKLMSNNLLTYINERDALENKVKELNKKIKEMNDSLLPLMNAQGLNSFKNAAGVTFYVNTATRASVKDPELAFPYMKKIGLDSLIKRTVNAQSLSSSLKELIANGDVMVSDFESQGISVYIDESIRVRNKGAAQAY